MLRRIALMMLALLAPVSAALPTIYGEWEGVGSWSLVVEGQRCERAGSVDLLTWGWPEGLFVIELAPGCPIAHLVARAEGDLETGFTFHDGAGLTFGHFRQAAGGGHELLLHVCPCTDANVGDVLVRARFEEAPTIIF